MKTILILAAVLLLVLSAAKSRFIAGTAGAEEMSDALASTVIPDRLEQSDETGPEVKLVLLALWPEGFEINEMQLAPGEYLFIIGNRTGVRRVSVNLDREGNDRLVAATVGGRQRDFKQRLKLTPGTYAVTADENPNWICRIRVR